jgi:EamA domain-containing membrane protein RarD
MKFSHKQAVMLMIACTMMWSIAGVVTRHLEHAKSFEVTFWRSFFTLVSLAIILPAIHGKTLLSKFKVARICGFLVCAGASCSPLL